MDLVDLLDSVKVVDSRIKTNLVEHRDASLNASRFELLHGVRNVRGRDDVLLELDGRLDDSRVVGIRNERDHEIVLLDSSVKFSLIGDIDRDGIGLATERGGESLGSLDTTASW